MIGEVAAIHMADIVCTVHLPSACDMVCIGRGREGERKGGREGWGERERERERERWGEGERESSWSVIGEYSLSSCNNLPLAVDFVHKWKHIPMF